MKTIRILTAALLLTICSALAQDPPARSITAYCYTMKSADALAFMGDHNPTGLPSKAMSVLRGLVQARKASPLAEITLTAPPAQYVTRRERDLEMELEYVDGPQTLVSLNAVLAHKQARVTGNISVHRGSGTAKPGEPMIKGLGFLGCAFTDATRREVVLVFLAAK